MQRASQNSINIYVFFLTWQRRQRICTIGIFKRKITNYYTQNFTRRINERSYRLSKPVPCFSSNPFFIRIHIYYPGLSTPSTRFPFPRSASLTTTVEGSKCRWRVWREKKKRGWYPSMSHELGWIELSGNFVARSWTGVKAPFERARRFKADPFPSFLDSRFNDFRENPSRRNFELWEFFFFFWVRKQMASLFVSLFILEGILSGKFWKLDAIINREDRVNFALRINEIFWIIREKWIRVIAWVVIGYVALVSPYIIYMALCPINLRNYS